MWAYKRCDTYLVQQCSGLSILFPKCLILGARLSTSFLGSLNPACESGTMTFEEQYPPFGLFDSLLGSRDISLYRAQ